MKLARVEENLTQGELAKMSGVTRQTIGAIESGKFNPTAKLALILCVILDKKFEELLLEIKLIKLAGKQLLHFIK